MSQLTSKDDLIAHLETRVAAIKVDKQLLAAILKKHFYMNNFSLISEIILNEKSVFTDFQTYNEAIVHGQRAGICCLKLQRQR